MSEPPRITERFEVERLAGAGGMGRVYQARDLATGERVAVKVLRADSFEVDRFDREARILADLSHPGIVRYVAHGATTAGERWLAMEWLEGEDLSHRLKRRELDLPETLALGLRAAEALGEAHRRGVVHRDVKPGNLFLVGGDAERCRLLDFGVARAAASPVALTRTGFMIGTPGYMAPEQIRGEKKLDARADVFSLGCVLFRCLTGRPAFVEDEDVLAMLLRVTLEPAPRVRELRPDLRPEIDDLLDRMLAKPPDARPPDGAAVAAEIARIQGGSSGAISWRPPPPVGREEQRLRCVLVGRAGEGEGAGEGELGAIAERFGGALQVLVDGSLVVTLGAEPAEKADAPPSSRRGKTGTDAATDQATRAARCALAFRARLPGVPLALFAGRTVVTSAAPAHVALDRGAAMLARGSAEGVLLDDVIASLLEARFEVREGDGGLYLAGERDLDETPRVLLGKPTVCVGRDGEIGRLMSYLVESIDEPMARAVLVTAPAGAGKSRLAHELLRRVRREQRTVAIWSGRADLMSAGSPFGMLASAIQHAAGVRPGEPLARRQDRLRAHVARRVPAAHVERVAAFLGEIASVPFGDAGPELAAARSDPRLLGDQMRRAWLSFLRAETDAAPLCLVLEDMHWGDAPSLGFVGAALRDLAERPFFVLGLGRPELHDAFPGLWADRALVEMKLGPLSRRASEKLSRAVLGAAVPRDVIDAIATRSGGNAFYVEELIRAVAEGRGDTWPETVLAMAEQRLDRLDPEARRVLRAASVFGETFHRGGVAALLGGAAHATDWLPELVQREVIERRGTPRFPGQEAFAFRHALVRDAAYAMLPEADRAAAHALAAAWLEEAGEDDALLLAEHHERGGDRDRARGFYRRAAEQALEGDDLVGAIARAERAIACGAAGEELGALRVLEGEAYAWRGEVEGAERVCTEAMALLPEGSTLWCQAAGVAIMAHLQLGHVDRFTALARALFTVDPAPGAADRFAVGSALVMAYLLTGGLYEFARAFMARTRAVLGPRLAESPVARGWIGWAECCVTKYETGDSWRHLKLADEGIAAFAEAGDVRGSIRIRMERAIALRQLGLFAEAEAQIEETLALSQRMGVRFLEAGSQAQLGLLRMALGRTGEAREAADQAIALYHEMGNTLAEAAAGLMRAMVKLAAGDATGALEDAAAGAATIAAPPGRAMALAVLAEARLARGDLAGALAAGEEASMLLTRLGSIPEGETNVRLVHAEALRAAGRTEEAGRVIAKAQERLRARADAIPDETVRHGFLTGVDVNRRTMGFAAPTTL